MKCEHCEILERKDEIIYEDDEVVVAVKDKVFTPGQITVFPKEHFTILEMIPEDILDKCASVANKVSIAAFESMGCQGTNIIIKNGLGAGQDVPHFGIEIVPRQETDGLNLQWDPKQLPEDEMEITFNYIKEDIENFDKEKDKSKSKKDKEEKKKDNKDNYMIKALKRVP